MYRIETTLKGRVGVINTSSVLVLDRQASVGSLTRRVCGDICSVTGTVGRIFYKCSDLRL
jgi:hypothetical protein